MRKYAESANEWFFTEKRIQDITSKVWFRERVLDIYFWHAGRKDSNKQEI